MLAPSNILDADPPSTKSSVAGGGVDTPTTEMEALRDCPAVHEWLQHSSEMNDTLETLGSLVVTRASDPVADATFLIIEKPQARALACYNGHLRLENAGNLHPDEPIPRRWMWLCTQKDGLKGFKNVAEGGFLGHDIWWDFYARLPHHKGWESFVGSRLESGYYWIQALHWWTLWQVSARPDGQGLFAQKDGGTLWEFVKVHGARDRANAWAS